MIRLRLLPVHRSRDLVLGRELDRVQDAQDSSKLRPVVMG